MKALLLSVVFLLLSGCSEAAHRIPAELVGVWAGEGAELKDGVVYAGQALYLGADGSGAVIGGPPPIGVKIAASFDATKNILSMDMIENGKVVQSVSVPYDSQSKILEFGPAPSQRLTRRLNVVDARLKKGLGF